MATDIAHWLTGLGLGRYAEAFAENAVDLETLPHLSDDDLKELGLPLGHRRKLQAAISELAGAPSADQPENWVAASMGSREIARKAERRQLTVVFCDLVESTALSARLDPEDMREVLRAYQDACSRVIARYDGYVAKFMGDGIYAYFGFPRAHEDDAERAINAGLEIVDVVTGLGHDLRARVGIATGTVAVGDIVGEGASEEAAVVGDAPNLAGRLQTIAVPGSVVVDPATYALVGGLFDWTDLGEHNLKGLEEPVRIWSALGARRPDSRFEATRGDSVAELIGREEELEILERRWKRTVAGHGQVVLISGEPGIGKSRLVHALGDVIADESHRVVRLQCSPYHTNSAMHPIAEHIEHIIGLSPGDPTDAALDKIEAWVSQSGQDPNDIAPLIAPFVGIEAADRYAESTQTPLRRKQLLLDAFVARTRRMSADRPTLLVVEDAHWIDPTTMGLARSTCRRL